MKLLLNETDLFQSQIYLIVLLVGLLLFVIILFHYYLHFYLMPMPIMYINQ